MLVKVADVEVELRVDQAEVICSPAACGSFLQRKVNDEGAVSASAKVSLFRTRPWLDGSLLCARYSSVKAPYIQDILHFLVAA